MLMLMPMPITTGDGLDGLLAESGLRFAVSFDAMVASESENKAPSHQLRSPWGWPRSFGCVVIVNYPNMLARQQPYPVAVAGMPRDECPSSFSWAGQSRQRAGNFIRCRLAGGWGFIRRTAVASCRECA